MTTDKPAPLVTRPKRPAFQFYPADWRKDMALQSCSVAARGLWIDMLCIAHECDPYGHLTVNGKPMTAAQIGRHTGLTERECARLVAELESAGVVSRAEDGALYSRRMVRDEDLRSRRAEGGKAGSEHGAKGAEHGSKGGRPKKERGDSKPPLEPPPSSSSSSSSSPSGVGERASDPAGASAPSPTRGSRLPKDWQPGPEQTAFAEGLGFRNGTAAAELAKFRDYWTAQPGQKGVKADWTATWRNWLRRASEDRGKAGGQATGGLDFDGVR